MLRRSGPGSVPASSGAVDAEPVPRAAHGLQRVPAERLVDLVPEMPDVDVDDVRPVLVREVPGVLEKVEAGEHLARPPHERLQQRELLCRELDLVLTDPAAARGRVEAEVADLEDRR